jgi:hypothetical protein
VIKAEGNTSCSEIHKLITSIWNKEELPQQLYLFIKRVIKLTVTIIEEYHCHLLYTKFYPIFLCQGYLHTYMTLLEIYNGTVPQLLIDFEKAYESVRREALYKFLIEFGIPMKLVRLIKICLNETYSKVHTGKNVSGAFPIQNGPKRGDVLSPLLFNFILE